LYEFETARERPNISGADRLQHFDAMDAAVIVAGLAKA